MPDLDKLFEKNEKDLDKASEVLNQLLTDPQTLMCFPDPEPEIEIEEEQ